MNQKEKRGERSDISQNIILNPFKNNHDVVVFTKLIDFLVFQDGSVKINNTFSPLVKSDASLLLEKKNMKYLVITD